MLKFVEIFVIIIIQKIKGVEYMTKAELMAEIGCTENAIDHHFPRLQEQMKKRGITLFKRGRGKKAEYGVMRKGDTMAKW